MLRSALVFIAASSYIAIASGIHHHFPAFVSASSLKAPGGQRHTGAFIENNKELSLQKRLAVSMALSPDGNDLSDAEAYHDMASASVDFTNVYARNGMVTGKFLIMFDFRLTSFILVSICFSLQQQDLLAISTGTLGGSSSTIFMSHRKAMAAMAHLHSWLLRLSCLRK